jgi:hypothetical protein
MDQVGLTRRKMEKNIVCAIKRRPEIDSRRGPGTGSGRQLIHENKIRRRNSID